VPTACPDAAHRLATAVAATGLPPLNRVSCAVVKPPSRSLLAASAAPTTLKSTTVEPAETAITATALSPTPSDSAASCRKAASKAARDATADS